MKSWTLDWDRGRATVTSTGAALHDLVFHLGGGRTVEPFAEAPWRDDPDIQGDASIPPHLRRLGGEWPCVPFGTSPFDPAHHGFGTDGDWELVERGDGRLAFACTFPPDHAVERLERSVAAVPGRPALEMTLAVSVRRDCRLPIGLHPIFRLPDADGALSVRPGAFDHGQVFPEPFQPGVSRLRPGARFEALSAVDAVDGPPVSLADLPSAAVREELVQLFGTDGTMVLADRAAGAGIRLTWDPAAFPHCLLWFSDGGRTARPWNGRFRGLGVEPVASDFDRADLAEAASSGTGTGMDFQAGRRWTTSYCLEAA